MSRSTTAQERLDRALALSRADRDAEADAVLRAVVEDFPDNAEARLRLSALAAEPTESVELLRAAAELASDDPLVLTRCAYHAFGLDALDDALRFALRAQETIVGDVAQFVLFPQLLHVFGRLAEWKGREVDAEEALTTAFELDPEMPGHGGVLAAFLWRQGKLDRALQVLDEAQRHCPDDEGLKELRTRMAA